MVAHEGVGVAVVDVARIAAEERAEALGRVGAVDRVEVGRRRVGPLGAQQRRGREQPGVGDRLGAVDRRLDDVDVGVVGGPVVGRDREHRLVVLAVPVPVERAREPGQRGREPARDRDADAVGGDRLEAAELGRAGEEGVAVLLFPQVVGLALVGGRQEREVGVDQAGRDRLGRGVELPVHGQQGDRLQGGAVGLVGPRARAAVDVEAGPVEIVARRRLAGGGERHVVDQRLVGREHARRVGGGQLERDDRRVPGPVVDVVLGDLGGGVLPGRGGEHAARGGEDAGVDRVVEYQAVGGDVPEHQPEQVRREGGRVALLDRRPRLAVTQAVAVAAGTTGHMTNPRPRPPQGIGLAAAADGGLTGC